MPESTAQLQDQQARSTRLEAINEPINLRLDSRDRRLDRQGRPIHQRFR